MDHGIPIVSSTFAVHVVPTFRCPGAPGRFSLYATGDQPGASLSARIADPILHPSRHVPWAKMDDWQRSLDRLMEGPSPSRFTNGCWNYALCIPFNNWVLRHVLASWRETHDHEVRIDTSMALWSFLEPVKPHWLRCCWIESPNRFKDMRRYMNKT